MQNRNEQSARRGQRLRLWLGAAAAAALTVPVARGERGFLAEALWNGMHFPAGGLIAGIMIYSEKLSGWSRAARWAWAAVALALFECFQPVVGRTFSSSDLFAGLCGWGAAGLLLLCPLRRTAYMAVLILAGLSFRLPVQALYDHARIRAAFPLIADFEDRLQLNRWTFRNIDGAIDDHPSDPARSILKLRGTADGGSYPGLFSTAYPRGWNDYRFMRVSIYMNSEKALWFRFDDLPEEPEYRDRAQLFFELKPGWNDVRVRLRDQLVTPSGRALNLDDIHRFGLFFISLETNEIAGIDKIILE